MKTPATFVHPVRAIKKAVRGIGGGWRVKKELEDHGFSVNRRAPTNIDKLLIGIPKNVLNELAHSLTQG